MKLVVYTAIFGRIGDQLQPPKNIPDFVDCHAYVDGVTEPQRIRGWLCKPAVWEHATNPRLRARRHKLLAHQLYPEVDFTLWVDGCLTPVTNPWDMVGEYLATADIAVFEHMERSCVYKELEACLDMRKDAPHIMRAQIDRYRQDGYPYNNGLGETTAVLRRHAGTVVQEDHISVNEFSEIWWDELRHNSVRDQLSFDYLMWKHGLDYNTFRGNRCRCPHFRWKAHR